MATSTAGNDEVNQESFSMKIVTYGIQKKFHRVRNITCPEFQKMITEGESNMAILDCRAPDEHAVSFISGGKRVDYDSATPWENIDLSNSQTVVCYCSVGYRSSIVAEKLHDYFKSQGRTDAKVYNLKGGIFQWAIEGHSMEGNHNEQVHPYSTYWGKLLPSNIRYSNL